MTLLLHSLNGGLLCLTARRILHLSRPLLSPTVGKAASLAAALAYSLHPVHMEVVGWPSAQPYALAGTFTLLCVLSYLPCTTLTPRLLLPLLFYAMAVFSKAASLTAGPAFILVIDLLRLAQVSDSAQPQRMALIRSLVLGKIPFALLAIALLALSVWANRMGTDRDADVVAL